MPPANWCGGCLALAWQFRGDCLRSLVLSVMLLLLGLVGLQLLGVVIDVIRHALDPAQRAPVYPFGWTPPAGWTPVHMVTVMAVAIVAQAVLRAVLTYHYNMTTARLTQGKIVPDLRDRVYDKLQRLSFRFFDVHGSSSIFNRVTGDVQNTRLFVDGVVLQGVNMLLTLAAYFVFMWRIQPSLTLACLSVTVALWWVTHYYSARLRPGLPAQPRAVRQPGAALHGKRPRDANGQGLCRGAAPGPALRGGQPRRSRISSKRIFRDLSHVHAADAGVVADEPGHPVRLRRLALCAGADSAGRRAGGVRRPAAAVQRAGGQHHHHRQLGAAELHGGPARVRGARHAVGGARTGRAPSCRGG